MSFPSHDLTSAPEESKPQLEAAQKAYGTIPGLYKVLSESPQAYQAYNALHQLFTATAFDAEELTVVWQSINVEHGCHYCVPAHSGIAKSMKVADEITEALRNETPLPSPKLEALRTFTVQMVRERGNVTDAQMQAFFDAGYGHRAVLDVILGLSQKTISNYVNHVAKTPVDAMFEPLKWERSTTPLAV
ncbi:carboxymuconolactone decarboxylase family protein [Shimia sp. MMG029]|uniref:carboxymuconolactone decarboxylase family protein n=1 Tax=Shimia sp. MMG029 TaxID=3021978 RepID=UPI0022FEE30B|nr:carboxymuconolactone decarboxylase family protein [Shimia sp. MMG029]MDA5558888.1 carboxymuconolactone decarboxylase family protein [Shimia sp. MMG029]